MAKGNKPEAKEPLKEAEEIKADEVKVESVLPEFVRVCKNGVTVTRHSSELQKYESMGWSRV